jgi:pimeloyl-ACP methyl ester carboxylesterase
MRRAAALAALALAIASPAVAADAPKPANRAEAQAMIADLRKVVTPNGIERREKVRIGGIDQWVTIRGHDRRNPVLLYIHGGPGYPMMPSSWWFQTGWEDYFTVVEWDQRGAGKTYLANDAAAVRPTLTRERMVADAEELTAWLRKDLGKDKIFVLGHSWGSYVGLTLAQRRPEWLHAYIGVGQIADGPEGERRGWAFAMDAARKAGNAKAVGELQAIAPYAAPGKPIPLKDLYVQRRWLGTYGGAVAFRSSFDAEEGAMALSPDYTDADIAKVWEASDASEEALLAGVVGLDMSQVRTLKCPLILLEGRHDYNVSSSAAAEWFAKVKAPAKSFVWFENSAHMPMLEEPGKFLVSLVRYARPIAEKAGDVAP